MSMPAFTPVLREDWCGCVVFEFVGLFVIEPVKLDDVVLELVGLEIEDEELKEVELVAFETLTMALILIPKLLL